MSYTSSPNQSSSSHGSTSQLLKNIQKLIDSDDDELITKKMCQLHGMFPVLKKINGTMSNQQKVSVMLRDVNFRHRLSEKLIQQNHICNSPVITINLYTTRYLSEIHSELTHPDLHQTFQRFGTITHLYLHNNHHTAYLQYGDYVSCFLAIKALDAFDVGPALRLGVKWCEGIDLQDMGNHFAAVNGKPQGRKGMMRYDIYLDNNNQFKISKRIIGPKGTNMKKILDAALLRSNLQLSIHETAKIRLRGQGSGFLQGPNNSQSDELLNLCISSKNDIILRLISQQVQKLMLKVSTQYKQYYYRIHKKQCQGIAYRKYELKKNQFQMIQQFNLEQINHALDFIQPKSNKQKLTEKQIVKMLVTRDRARKNGRFKEADEIRNMLKKEGVCIIDQNNTNGKQCKTTWKYCEEF